MNRHTFHLGDVKSLRAPLASVLMLGMIGCANEGPTAGELQEQVSRGVRGEGSLAPEIDRTNDPYVKSREGAAPRPE